MKVLLVNGSPHQKGETYNALSLVEKALHEKGAHPTNPVGEAVQMLT